MTNKIGNFTETMFARPNPAISRAVAYVLAVSVVGTDWLLGGSSIAFLAALLLVGATCFILPAREPRDHVRQTILAALQKLRLLSWRVRLAVAVLPIVAASVLNDQVGGLGGGFNILLIPIFLTSLLFGLPLAILSWILSFFSAYFWLIPPRYSFEIVSLTDFSDLMIFFYLGLVSAAIPTLITASSAVDEKR